MSDSMNEGIPPKVWRMINERASTNQERRVDADAYRKIVARIEGTKDAFAKRVYSQVLEFAIDEGAMRFSYIADNVLDEALKEQKLARKELQPFELFEVIETILSRATSTENFGHSRRWPLSTSTHYSKTKRITGRKNHNLGNEVLPANFRGGHYHFGVHSFAVGKATEEIVRMIEKRYSISFRELEKRKLAKGPAG